ncbi:MAG: hypothetical protein ACYDDS_15430 [Candidatus Sulfotelmatobacter sp.]
MTKYSEWPRWLQLVVFVPNALLLWFIAYPWFPKSKRQWIWTGVAIAYLLLFFSVMHFVFGL